jgi:hypothetical protein
MKAICRAEIQQPTAATDEVLSQMKVFELAVRGLLQDNFEQEAAYLR